MSDKSNSVIILRSYWESIKDLPDDKQLLFLKSIIEYGMNNIEPEFTGIEKSFWIQIKATIDNSMKRYNTSIENGKKGGAPKGNNNAKKQPETTQQQPKSTQEQPKTTIQQPETKVDNLYKDKDKDKYKDVDKDKYVDKDVIRTNILGDFDRKKFYNSNIQEIEHIRTLTNLSVEESVDLHYEALQAMKSVFG
jgi:uncharacterized protein YdaU (DUF1376 family)